MISATIIGLGNILFQDEGFGVHLIKFLKKNYSFPEGFTLIDGGCAGLSLINLIRDKDLVFIVDVYLSDSPPGTLKVFSWEEIENLGGQHFASVHQFGVKDALGLARLYHIRPKTFKAYAVVPESMELGTELSPTLRKNLPLIAERIVKDLRELNFVIREENSLCV
ncbi:hydrogenase maturation protease [Thermodesulfatator indicus]